MSSREQLTPWVLEAVKSLGGSASVVEVCRYVWDRHESDLRRSGDLFYTWQYDIRWAAQVLRHEGSLKPSAGRGAKSRWELP